MPAARCHRLPACDVPDRGARRADSRRSTSPRRRRRCPKSASSTWSGTSSNLSTLNMSIDTQLLSARVVHDEVQPEAARAARRAAGLRRPASAARTTTRCQGMLQLLYEMQEYPRRDRRPAGRVAAAGRRRAGRTDRPAGRRRLLPRQGRDARTQGARPRQRPRHQPRQRRASPASRPSPSRATPTGLVDLDDLQGEARRPHRRVHDHQPEHARPVRAADRRRSPSWSTTHGGAGLPRRREHERHPRHHPARATSAPT